MFMALLRHRSSDLAKTWCVVEAFPLGRGLNEAVHLGMGP